MATTAMTEETPIRMPSTVSSERSLFARRDCSAMLMASPNCMSPPSGPVAGLVALDLPVPDVDHAVGVVGDVLLVGDEDDRVAVPVQLVEQATDVPARARGR